MFFILNRGDTYEKSKSIIAIALILSVIFVFAGCGCQNTSDQSSVNPSDQSNTTNSSSNENKPSTTTGGTDFEPTKSIEQRKAVKVENYIDGKNFDLNGYAEALGFTKVDDPKGAVYYVIKRGDTKCFFTFTQHVIVALFDKNDGYTYQADPIEVPSTSESFIINTGAKEGQQSASKMGLSDITNALFYLSTTDNVEIDNLPVFVAVFKLEGSPVYYPNGAMQKTGKTIETIRHR